MPDKVKITVWEEESNQPFVKELDLPFELGRQGFFMDQEGKQCCEPGIGEFYKQKRKLIIAPFNETKIGRTQALLENKDATSLLVQNKHNSVSFAIQNGPTLPPNDRQVLKLPFILKFPRENGVPLLVGISEPGKSDPILESKTDTGSKARISKSLLNLTNQSLEPQELVKWLKSVFDVLNSASSNNDFFARAAQSAVEMVDLDHAQVILREKDTFACKSFFPTTGSASRTVFSKRIVEETVKTNKTIWRPIDAEMGAIGSLESIDEIVAAPIHNHLREPIGVLYGVRSMKPFTTGMFKKRDPISEVEASLIEVLAGVVTTGISRLEQEKAAVAARVQMEQVFTTELAHQLAETPDWGIGRVMDVSVLFCDIQGFSKISEKLPPSVTIHWIQDVLSELSDCILNQGGVVVNYIGDAVMGLWGAPKEQDDHAARACRAAIEMRAQLPKINNKWQSIIGYPTEITIGINSGMSQVGNIGSTKKIQYGAHGSIVNLASRIQGVTKYLKAKMLITEATRTNLPENIFTRRLGSIRPNNFDAEVTVHELIAPDNPDWPDMKTHYEGALIHFEVQNFQEAAKTLVTWRSQCNLRDEAALVLISKAVNGMLDGPSPHHPVWVLKEK